MLKKFEKFFHLMKTRNVPLILSCTSEISCPGMTQDPMWVRMVLDMNSS